MVLKSNLLGGASRSPSPSPIGVATAASFRLVGPDVGTTVCIIRICFLECMEKMS